ncbi:hypothetical protein HanPI659440_Chr14g0551111 [Helianthus annuus]|nr:hypothetical protein HanPI659440_Chr14g0551111 [Helianthus annuus]
MNARRKPVITMLEEIRMFIMERNYEMSKRSLKWEGNVCPTIRTKIQEWSKESRKWIVIQAGAMCLRYGMEMKLTMWI